MFDKTVLKMGHKICFNRKIWIIIHKLSLLPLHIWSTDLLYKNGQSGIDNGVSTASEKFGGFNCHEKLNNLFSCHQESHLLNISKCCIFWLH